MEDWLTDKLVVGRHEVSSFVLLVAMEEIDLMNNIELESFLIVTDTFTFLLIKPSSFVSYN